MEDNINSGHKEEKVMGFFSKQFASVIEWNESSEGTLFWKFQSDEIKKDSRLIVRPGQDAIFLYNGKVEGVFTDEGNFEVESEIVPFLTTLKSFKFGFNTPLRAEVLFINTKEILVNSVQIEQDYEFVSKDGIKTKHTRIHFGHVGYPYLVDLNPDSSSIRFPENMCVSSICDGENIVPNWDYSTCIRRRVTCEQGRTKYRIGSREALHCDVEQTAVPQTINEVDPVYQYPLSSAQTFKTNPSFEYKDRELCLYTCTENGWVVRVNDRSCADGYVPSYNKRACLALVDIVKGLCEKTGGVIAGNRCKCQSKTKKKTYQYDEYEYCDDPKSPVVEPEKILVSVENELMGFGLSTSSTSNATNFADTDSISTLVANLSQIEKQFGLSKWRTVDGKFNYARLASDATAGVVLGTTGALVTASVIKKKQVEDGFESLECTVGGQHVGDWGDVFRIDGK